MSDLEKLQRFLRTDARDVGCDEARAVLHISINLVAADQDVAGCYPGDATHLSACGPVRAVRTSPGSASRSRTSSGCGRHRGGFRAPGRALGLAAADCPRPKGRTVEDVALILLAISGPDPRCRISLSRDGAVSGELRPADLRRPRAAWSLGTQTARCRAAAARDSAVLDDQLFWRCHLLFNGDA
jgi:hypothetical protein